MLVIGIDPGAAKTGIASVNATGQFRFSTLWADNRVPFRYGTFRDELAGFLVELDEDPTVIAIEQPEEIPEPGDGPDKFRSLIRVNCICAVIVSEVSRLWPNTPLLPWAPRIWRRQEETKADVAYRMSVKYGVDFETDDESDALGIADYAIMRLLGGDRSAGAIGI
jgi:hypothetical protein